MTRRRPSWSKYSRSTGDEAGGRSGEKSTVPVTISGL